MFVLVLTLGVILYTIIYYILYYYILYIIYYILYLILYSSPFLPFLPFPLDSIKGIDHLSMFKGYTSISNNPSLRNPIFSINIPIILYVSVLTYTYLYSILLTQSNYPASSINQVIILNSCESKILKTSTLNLNTVTFIHILCESISFINS